MNTSFNTLAIAVLLLAGLPVIADSDLILPTRLINNDDHTFYTRQDVCQHARKTAPEKKAAMIIVKTHYCDKSSRVCLKTTALVADPANHLVHDNFTVYQSRFESEGRQIRNSGEKSIREEWDKDDSGPEFYIMDVSSCDVVFRDYAYSVYRQGMHQANAANTHLDFAANYRAMRHLLLQDESVVQLLGSKYQHLNEEQIQAELTLAGKIRQRHQQKALTEVLRAINQQDAEHGLM